jgi:hypothetical protein
MSRRMGPGGRLRPSPRMQRSGTRLEPGRAAGFIAPQAPEGGHNGIPGHGMGHSGHGGVGGRPGGRLGISPYDDLRPLPGLDPALAGELDADAAAALHPAGDAGGVGLVGQTFEDERHGAGEPGSGSDAHGRPFERQRPAMAPPERVTPACTAPQLRRFIKSRAYVPMHELRRRFGIEGGDDDVSPIDLATGRLFVGLPMPEGQLLGDLLRGGEIGCELSMDPQTPIVVGVYAMRPVPRP